MSLGPYVGPDPYTGPGLDLPDQGFSVVTVEEAIGSGMDLQPTPNYVHLLAADLHSPQSLLGYTVSPLRVVETITTTPDGDLLPPGPVFTYERWIRLRYEQPFGAVFGIRFWLPNATPIPGWDLSWGTTSTYTAPVNTQSAIATGGVPTTDPGSRAPNVGGFARLSGPGTQYSDWIVMQAVADPALVGPGPIFGFSIEGTLIPIQFNIAWIED